ncbi:site-specific DNA-methyltransferase [Rhodoferax sp. AJA081-3]|uniref:site-specific DNA-methyltransferase n=1 Tax=Rhodoferax sp. AJA081-3 TaxID=2752316 RepID=UPI001ADF375E|nr:site-specific DNA-methyltransferase [Rhodoferax sp. AJA081-3]QTN28013.1 site-specific DNA-methyltransferase [Rhodoferax sp. AJA081-3]
MAQVDLDPSEQLLIDQLPLDGSAVGNSTLAQRWINAMQAIGLPANDAAFQDTRNRLLETGLVSRGKGRGGSTFRTAVSAPDAGAFELGTSAPSELTEAKPKKAAGSPTAKRKPTAQSADDSAQVLSYRHTDKRKNNPEVGLVNEASDPQQPKKEWVYNPHLDPVLNFDSSRSELENQVADALDSNDPAVMKAVLEQIQRRGAPYLQWAGKAERTSFEVDTVSLHVHERIDPMSILSAVRKGGPGEKNAKPANEAKLRQASLFEAPFENLPLRDAVDFYRHDKGWANRLVSGDSLQVMNSLLVKEGMAGQVQMVYIDPPYGIKYGSNFQPFVGKRDVKDKSDADLTQEPEMIKAFRDTWELGIHSYLTYLRDRLLVARELLSESGSVFVQISEENLHLIRSLLQEVFGEENFVSVVTVVKTSAQEADTLPNVCDYLVWYAKSKSQLKYRKLWLVKDDEDAGFSEYSRLELPDFRRRLMTAEELEGSIALPADAVRYRQDNIVSQRPPGSFPVPFQGTDFVPLSGYWKTGVVGFERLIRAARIELRGRMLSYVRFLDDFPVRPISNFWTDVRFSSRSEDKAYVVQTAARVIERCMLMTTDPGDLVLDPTCGSGSTASVAEKWGRRWITCDTSRVALTLAKQRLMTASYDYFELAYPHEGLKGGFIYKTVPHVMLKSIANNADIDAIYERQHPAIEDALATLNAAFAKHTPLDHLTVTEGVRKGQKLKLGANSVALHEWEMPFPGGEGELPPGWPPALREPFDAFHAARQRMQTEMDRSIAASAENETLYDQPDKSKTKLRITGPFTVEAVPFPTVLSLEAAEGGASATPTEDQAYQTSIARSGESNRQQQWRDELLKTGIRGKGGQKLEFAELDVMAGTICLHATGTLADTGERVVVSFGPEHGALEQRQVEHALNEAEALRPKAKFVVFCAFTFDPEAAKDIDETRWAGVTLLKAQMNTDLLTEDLKKGRSSNQSFWLMGQPDVALTQTADGLWQVEVNGFDYFDTAKGELISGGKGKIAMWSLDTDYDGRSLFPHQVFFPMAGKDEGWKKLKKTIRAELDESLLDQFHGTVSLPFEASKHGKAAVKIVDDRGIESLKILPLVKGVV